MTNDDGPQSMGLLKLAEALASEMEVVIVVPDGERSASGKALTFNRPLRVKKQKTKDGVEIITHDGAPADSVILAHHFVKDIDLFVSGINAGANVTYQSMLTSGTVGAAIEAAIMGYPAIAVSVVVKPSEWFNNAEKERDYSRIVSVTCRLIKKALEHGLPSGIDALNLNFPSVITDESKIIATKPARVRIQNEIEERTDPNQSPYYWVRGIEKEPPADSDAYEVLYRGNISLSPIVIEALTESNMEKVRRFISE
ncbi:MAG: 5'/3'-nucleotidase SurE [Candidatus Thorarchaeota archaeon]|nr:5'/3'-nucleotidase SurE [Candidatus Thorarchaeota archaeon]